jgi:hypothetical protein
MHCMNSLHADYALPGNYAVTPCGTKIGLFERP